MKQKDYLVIVVAVVISGIFSLVVCSKFIAPPKNRQQKVEVVTAINSEFKLPDAAVFNSNAVNPTKLIEIGPNTNNQPFVKQ